MSINCSFPSYAKTENPSDIHTTSTSSNDMSKGKGKKIIPAQKIICKARLTENSPFINSGVSWHVFDTTLNKKDTLSTIKKIIGGIVYLELFPGDYLVSASFGHVGVVKRITVTPTKQIEKHTFVFNAGGIRLYSIYKPDSPIVDDELTFSIYSNPNQKPLMIADKVSSGTLIRLLGSTNYQITSHYGKYNAVVSTIVKVESGKVIDVTIQNRASKTTFKLVSEAGGEAIADTAWSILTAGGDTVGESVHAFPSMILSEGDYVVIARNKERIYSREFSVTTGKNKVIEVIMKQKRVDKSKIK
ncbi:hypothetical protein AP064_05335 [Candidatus Liberibacter solanacearum]|nr:hypothetical protein [Candidatus Liberibacter solanacearum]KJZ80669.1 hypothetical protein KP07_05820 [Candidatus Liberibacter solanacearum]KQC48701.1 hypothetical protein AP064_05335 [Candidatus Liberibacter solanacearum]